MIKTHSFRDDLNAPQLSVVIPCHNESETIEETLRVWSEVFQKVTPHYEVIVINDGSTDGTGRILDRLRREIKAFRVIHQLKGGYGRSVRRGIEEARGDYVFQMEANGRYEPHDFLALWEMRAEHHLILGIRDPRMSNLIESLFAPIIMRTAKFMFGVTVQDPNTPFRLFRRVIICPYLRSLPADFEAINLGITLPLKREYPQGIAEIPITLLRLPHGKHSSAVRLKLGQALAQVAEILRLRLGHRSALPQTTKQNPAIDQPSP